MSVYGYIRVSTKDQNEARQRIAMQEFGVDLDKTVLDMPLLDTRKNRDLTGVLIADIVLGLLSYVAETERQIIRQRQAEVIQAEKERGALREEAEGTSSGV